MLASPARTRIASHWWVPLVRGLIAIAFGVVVLLDVRSSVYALVVLFGAFAFVDGILNIVTALRFAHPDTGRWWAILVQGIAGILIGVVTFYVPGLTAATLGLLIAVWAIVTGILELIAAFRLRRDIPGEIFLIVAGLLSLAAGLWLIVFPIAALVALTFVIGIYALVGGVALVVLAFRLRSPGGGTLRA